MAQLVDIYEDERLKCVGMFQTKYDKYFAANTYIFVNKKTHEACVVDLGSESNELYEYLDNNGYKVSSVIFTHLHHDHILGYYKARYVFDVEFLMSEVDALNVNNREYTYLYNEQRPVDEKSNGFGEYVQKANEYKNANVDYGKNIHIDKYLHDLEHIQIAGFDCIVFETPGHTKGSVCIQFVDFPIMITGDTIFDQAVGRYDLKSGNLNDLRRSIHKILDNDDIANNCIFLPGHGDITTKLEFER